MDKNIDSKLKYRNILPTAMRELVLEILLKQKQAISLKQLESIFDHADRSTLFRTLKTFEDKKIIHSIDDGTGSVKYAVCYDSCNCSPDELHAHFHCIKCTNTYCLNDISVPTLRLPIGFSANSVNMVFKGICSNCRSYTSQ